MAVTSSDTHCFNTSIASIVGVNAAVIHYNISHWVSKNQANNKHFYDDAYWSYNSVNAFLKLFPYLSISQIKTSINKLVETGLVKKGNYNKVGYDRTTWYTICQESPMDKSELTNGESINDQPIPDINTDINTIPPIAPQEGGSVVSDEMIRKELLSLLKKVNPKLIQSRRVSPNAAFRKFKSKVILYGLEPLVTSISDFYLDKEISKDNYMYAPSLMPVLNQEKFFSYISVDEKDALIRKSSLISDMKENTFVNLIDAYIRFKTWNVDMFGPEPDDENSLISDQQRIIYEEIKKST